MIIQSHFALKLTKEIYKNKKILKFLMTSELIQKKVFFAIFDDVIRFFKKKVNIYIPIGNRNQTIKFLNVQYRG